MERMGLSSTSESEAWQGRGKCIMDRGIAGTKGENNISQRQEIWQDCVIGIYRPSGLSAGQGGPNCVRNI